MQPSVFCNRLLHVVSGRVLQLSADDCITPTRLHKGKHEREVALEHHLGWHPAESYVRITIMHWRIIMMRIIIMRTLLPLHPCNLLHSSTYLYEAIKIEAGGFLGGGSSRRPIEYLGRPRRMDLMHLDHPCSRCHVLPVRPQSCLPCRHPALWHAHGRRTI